MTLSAWLWLLLKTAGTGKTSQNIQVVQPSSHIQI
jgi:hypothetical protein